MDNVTKQRQKKLVKQTQKRLNRLMKLLMKVHLSKRSNSENEVFEEFVRRSLAGGMMSTGFSPGPFGITPTPTSEVNTDISSDSDIDATTMCYDIQGRDRACCNSAVRCFGDIRTVVDNLENEEPGTFTLQSACRRVASELKRDKLCVQQSLSRCGGPDRGVLQRRFDGRMNTLYDQFYKHCRRQATTTTSTTSVTNTSKFRPTIRTETETPRPPPPTARTEFPPGFFPTAGPHDHNSHDGHTHFPPVESSSSGALIAGVVTGGIIFGLILLIVVVFWCKNRKERNGSNGSMDSRTGIFFQKRPNMFSPNRPRGNDNNNSKHPVTRQESDVYAEIDEEMVNPGFKPPVPGSLSLPGYLHPVSDDDSGSSYTPAPTSQPRPGGSPFVTTRGQLSYGPIFAANGVQGGTYDTVTPYHSTTLTFPDKNDCRDSRINSSETLLSTQNLPSDSAQDFRMSAMTDGSEDGLDEYEQPISAHSSMRYATLDNNLAPPETFAPAVPDSAASEPPLSPVQKPELAPKPAVDRKKTGIKVLPSNPFAPHTSPRSSGIEMMSPQAVSASSSQPVPQPRKKKEQNAHKDVENQSKVSSNGGIVKDNEKTPQSPEKCADTAKKDLVKKISGSPTNRDSHMSNGSSKSSHHYFVLEPESKNDPMDYENSVSSPKLV